MKLVAELEPLVQQAIDSSSSRGGSPIPPSAGAAVVGAGVVVGAAGAGAGSASKPLIRTPSITPAMGRVQRNVSDLSRSRSPSPHEDVTAYCDSDCEGDGANLGGGPSESISCPERIEALARTMSAVSSHVSAMLAEYALVNAIAARGTKVT
ncbi:hypothetical protein B484DRAFT_411685, partial [Ochromonadaceae sp. CCMP2298]